MVHQTERCTIYHGKAEEVLPTMATGSFGLVVTDPPYGIDFSSGRRAESYGTIHGDGVADRKVIRGVLGDCVRLVGPDRHLYVFGPSDVLEGLRVGATASLVWDKAMLGAGNLSLPWGPAHEPLTFAISKHHQRGRVGDDSPVVRMRKGSVLRFTRPSGRGVRHPNEKPVALLRELIESSSRQGDTVLDPYAGSGSTAVAALLSGRKAVLVESDARWLPLIIERTTKAEAMAEGMASL